MKKTIRLGCGHTPTYPYDYSGPFKGERIFCIACDGESVVLESKIVSDKPKKAKAS